MKRAICICMVALVLAGCSGATGPDQAAAKQAAEASIEAVADQYDYLLFLGITGTEGPLNWTLYEEALRSASDPGSSIADGFDQDRDHGTAGDGRVGSWLTTHFVFDEDRQLLGGLYTQYAAGALTSIYAPFRGPYPGTPGLPGLQPDVGLGFERRAEEASPALCGLVSSTAAWRVDSADAAAIASSRSIMADHVAAFPEGEFTYYYFPGLDVESGCDAQLDIASNYWVISHVDLDDYLKGGLPSVAEVRIDAATGEVLAEEIRPLYQRVPTIQDRVIADTDPQLPPTMPTRRNVSFIVDPFVASLDVTVTRSEAPTLERAASTRLMDPTGRIWDSHAFDGDSHAYRVRNPAPGSWTIEYIHQAAQPGGSHHVEVHTVATYT